MWSRSRWWPATLAGQFLVLQLTVLLAVVAVASIVSVQQSDADFRDTRGARLRAAAESMANTAVVRDAFVADRVESRRGTLTSYTQRVRNNVQASGVYLTDPDGAGARQQRLRRSRPAHRPRLEHRAAAAHVDR